MPSITTGAPMPNSRRAKQFMSFDALQGLKDAIAATECSEEPRRCLTDDAVAQINNQLQKLQKGQTVAVVYYGDYEKQYLQQEGIIEKIDNYWKVLQIGNTTISFSEIYEIIV